MDVFLIIVGVTFLFFGADMVNRSYSEVLTLYIGYILIVIGSILGGKK